MTIIAVGRSLVTVDGQPPRGGDGAAYVDRLGPEVVEIGQGATTVVSLAGNPADGVKRLRAVLEPAGYAWGEHGPTGWATAYRPGHVVHVYRDDLSDPWSECAALGGLGSDDVVVAWARLDWWRRATGRPYHGTPGLSCLDVLRASLGSDKGRYPARDTQRPEIEREGPVQAGGELVWRRARHLERTGHRWDTRSAYLAAASAAHLGWGQPRPTGTDPTGPGWYRIVVPPKTVPMVAGVPVVDPARVDRKRTVWVTEPVVSFLAEIGQAAEVVDSYTSLTGGRLLRPWAERWRDIGYRGNDRARSLLKRGYVEAIGLLGRPGGRIHRPDWHDTIRAQARVSLLRRIGRVHTQTGWQPASVNVDAVYYPDRVDPEKISDHIGTGDRIGNMRYEGYRYQGVVGVAGND